VPLRRLRRPTSERFIQRDDLVRWHTSWQLLAVEIDSLEAAAVNHCFLPPGILDEDAAHGLRRRREEVGPAVEPLVADESQERLVDQGGRLEGLPRGFVSQLLSSEAAQLVVDQRQELAYGARLTSLEGA
jgi:hypothetical protein